MQRKIDATREGLLELMERVNEPVLEDALYLIANMRAFAAAEAAKEKILRLAKITQEAAELYAELKKEHYDDLDNFGTGKIWRGCKIDDEGLKSAEGDILSRDGRCMDELLGYFVNQSCGYCEDDYFGTMFVSVDDNGTFVEINYSC